MSHRALSWLFFLTGFFSIVGMRAVHATRFPGMTEMQYLGEFWPIHLVSVIFVLAGINMMIAEDIDR